MPSRARPDSTDPRLSAPKAVKPGLELGQSRLGLAVFHCALAPTCAGQARKGQWLDVTPWLSPARLLRSSMTTLRFEIPSNSHLRLMDFRFAPTQVPRIAGLRKSRQFSVPGRRSGYAPYDRARACHSVARARCQSSYAFDQRAPYAGGHAPGVCCRHPRRREAISGKRADRIHSRRPRNDAELSKVQE